MPIPNHPLWADAAHASPNIIPSKGLSPPSAHPCPAYIEVPWDQVSISSSGIVLQGMTGFMSAPVPFNEAMGLQLHNGSNHGIIPSSASSRMNPIEVVSTAQQGPRPFKLVHQPEQGVSGNAAAVTPRMSGAPAQAGKSANADAMAPQVVRHRIGTPAVISSADKRRVHPRKYRCHICGRMFTSKANRDRHVRAHYGIKPFVCLCSVAFTTKADLSRHRKSSRCPFPAPTK